jgi:hypothetical protein
MVGSTDVLMNCVLAKTEEEMVTASFISERRKRYTLHGELESNLTTVDICLRNSISGGDSDGSTSSCVENKCIHI